MYGDAIFFDVQAREYLRDFVDCLHLDQELQSWRQIWNDERQFEKFTENPSFTFQKAPILIPRKSQRVRDVNINLEMLWDAAKHWIAFLNPPLAKITFFGFLPFLSIFYESRTFFFCFERLLWVTHFISSFFSVFYDWHFSFI